MKLVIIFFWDASLFRGVSTLIKVRAGSACPDQALPLLLLHCVIHERQ